MPDISLSVIIPAMMADPALAVIIVLSMGTLFMNGAGLVELRKGTSELISNDFAKRSESEGWDDITKRRFHVDPKHVNDIFQHLVNLGLLDNEKHFRGTKKPRKDRFMGVKACISNQSFSEQVNIFEVDPELAENLLDVIGEFDVPSL